MIISSNNLVERPLVSVVICTYNQEKYIAQTIESILNQECDFEYEIIIGEDCGQDTTRDICIAFQQKFPEKIKLVLHEKNQGILKNYRAVLHECRGIYIAQCAGDDYWIDIEKLKNDIQFLSENQGFGVVRSGFYYLNMVNGKFKEAISYPKNQGKVFDLAKNGTIALPSNICFEKDLLRLIDFDVFISRNFSCEDFPMQAIFAFYTKFGFINKITAVYRVFESSMGNPKDPIKFLKYNEGLVEIRKYLAELFPNDVEFNELEWEDFLNFKKLRVSHLLFDYSLAKESTNKLKLEKYTNKNIVKFSKISLSFYLICIIKKVYNYFKSKEQLTALK